MRYRTMTLGCIIEYHHHIGIDIYCTRLWVEKMCLTNLRVDIESGYLLGRLGMAGIPLVAIVHHYMVRYVSIKPPHNYQPWWNACHMIKRCN